ncbi:MAG: GTP pyrophosphokinase family protein [Lachnospiraceae bacterium]|nr:GTP pyrophosphokinase family protein [Lachnospiraceae bacterium]
MDAKTIAWLQEKTKDFGKLMTYYRCAMMEIETKFNVLNEEFSLEHDRNPINSIKTRLKSVPSIREKLERRNIAPSLAAVEENLSDIAGVRVICSFVDDVYVLAHALLQQDDVELIEKKDYIASPKPNGYRSLHLIVGIPIFLKHEKRIMKVEIQLRTIAMDFWASLEHQLRYKKDFLFSNEMAKELQECAELSAVLDSRMDNLRKSVSSSDDKQQKNKKSV